MQAGCEKNYEFRLKIVEENHNVVSVDSENKIISVEIGNPEHKDLSVIINDAITKVV